MPLTMILGAALSLAWLMGWRFDDSASPPHQLLVDGLGGVRFAEPRFSGFSSWSSCASGAGGLAPRCGPDAQGQAARKARLAVDRIARAAARRPSLATLHALGVASLWRATTRSSSELEESIRQLEAAARQGPGDAKRWNDLAAGLLLRALATGRPEDAATSLEATARSLEIEPSALEASFNQALALERLHLVRPARRAWEHYLAMEKDEAWAAEARQRLAQLEVTHLPSKGSLRSLTAEARWTELERDLAAAPVAGLNLALDELLPAWATAIASDRAPLLAAAQRIGQRIHQLAGDALLSEVVEGLVSARGAVPCAEGLELYGQARALYLDLDSQAGPVFRAAARQLAGCGSALALWSRYYAAIELHRSRQAEEALTALRSLEAGGARYPLMQAHVRWYLGLMAATRHLHDAALAHYDRALAVFEEVNAVEEAGYLHILEAEVRTYFGETRAAWDHFSAALVTAESWPEPRRRRSLWNELASHLALRGQPRGALIFSDLTVEEARESGKAWTIIAALADRAEKRVAASRASDAEQDLTEARRWFARLKSEEQRRAESRLATAEAVTAAALGDPDRALERLDRAAELLSAGRVVAEQPRVFSARARALVQKGRLGEAAAAFEESVLALEAGGHSAARESSRSGLLGSTRQVVDEAVQFTLDIEADSEKAFAYAERARALEYLGRGSRSRSFRPLTFASAASSLPPSTAAVAYWALPDRLLVWVVGPSGVHTEQLAVGREPLHALVTSLLAAPNRGDAAQSLSQVLWQPIAARVEGVGTVLVAADGPLHRLPWGLLTEPATGRSILERHAVIKILGGFPAGADRPELGESPRALLIGDPAFSASRFPRLPRLPAAQREVQALAELFPGATLLLGTAATHRQVLSELPRQQVVHVAAHALVAEDNLDRSALVLAADGPEEESTLAAEEVELLDLSGTRLVVLSACESARGGDALPPAVAGLARPFLAAGVNVVVASHWPVGDEASAALLVRFHENLAAGSTSAAEALRQAQLSIMQESAPLKLPAAWAGFEVFVGRKRP